MKKILLIILVFSFYSCTPKLTPLYGTYPSTPILFTTSSSFNSVWDKLVDFFAQNGYSIKIIDRSSGLIVASTTKMDASYEDRKGILVKKHALVVVPHYRGVDPRNKMTLPPKVIGDWNVRIKESDGKTSININLVNLQMGYYTNSGSYSGKIDYVPVDGRTTGIFEKNIYDVIK